MLGWLDTGMLGGEAWHASIRIDTTIYIHLRTVSSTREASPDSSSAYIILTDREFCVFHYKKAITTIQ